MKREIKFEYGFESVNGIIKKVYHLHQIPNIKEICDCWNVLPLSYVRLFASLKDKNGVDIYEGDILSHSRIAGVVFEMIWDINKNKWTIYSPKDAFEIIGNIYENPELLNKQKHNENI